VPARDVARRAARELKFGEGSFTAAVAEVLSRVGGCRITPADFQEDKLPDFLRMNVRVIDDKGDLLAAGRDLAALQRQLGATAAQMFSKIDDPRWTRDGCTTWDFGDLPAQVELLRGGLRLVGYPAVIDQGASVGLRLLDTPPRAELEMRRGVLRLCYLAAKRELTQHVGWLPRLDQLLLWAASLGQAQTLQQQLAERIAEQAFLCDGPLPRTGDAFNRCLTTGRGRLSGVVQEVAGVVTALLQEAHQACVALHQATAPQMAAAVLDLRRQLAALAPSGFLATTPWKWLRHYPRYFKAVQLRLEKLGRNLARDAAQREIFDPLWEAYAQRAAKHAAAGRLDSELTHYRWMLEEFRVSLFAQELGTALPVSVKRLAQQWEKVPP
jgi:ATP-dependent helicase HrpA